MKKYSITKYCNDGIKRKEWTSISDIGKKYSGIVFDVAEYMMTENAYVNAILKIMTYMNIESLWIKNIFKWKDLKKDVKGKRTISQLYTDSMLKTYEEVKEGDRLNKENVCDLIRLELREDIGGLLYVPYRLKIFIGYDYMMGVHSSISLEKKFEDITELGLNIYRFS